MPYTEKTKEYVRIWRLENKERHQEMNRRHAKKAMKRKYDFEKMCRIFRNISV